MKAEELVVAIINRAQTKSGSLQYVICRNWRWEKRVMSLLRDHVPPTAIARRTENKITFTNGSVVLFRTVSEAYPEEYALRGVSEAAEIISREDDVD